MSKDFGKGGQLVSALLFAFGTVTFVFNVASIIDTRLRFSENPGGQVEYPAVRLVLVQILAYAIVVLIAMFFSKQSRK